MSKPGCTQDPGAPSRSPTWLGNLDRIFCLPRRINRALDGKWSSWDWNPHIWDTDTAHTAGRGLICYSTVLAPKRASLRDDMQTHKHEEIGNIISCWRSANWNHSEMLLHPLEWSWPNNGKQQTTPRYFKTGIHIICWWWSEMVHSLWETV